VDITLGELRIGRTSVLSCSSVMADHGSPSITCEQRISGTYTN
jgi:hypothetical protein